MRGRTAIRALHLPALKLPNGLAVLNFALTLSLVRSHRSLAAQLGCSEEEAGGVAPSWGKSFGPPFRRDPRGAGTWGNTPPTFTSRAHAQTFLVRRRQEASFRMGPRGYQGGYPPPRCACSAARQEAGGIVPPAPWGIWIKPCALLTHYCPGARYVTAFFAAWSTSSGVRRTTVSTRDTDPLAPAAKVTAAILALSGASTMR